MRWTRDAYESEIGCEGEFVFLDCILGRWSVGARRIPLFAAREPAQESRMAAKSTINMSSTSDLSDSLNGRLAETLTKEKTYISLVDNGEFFPARPANFFFPFF